MFRDEMIRWLDAKLSGGEAGFKLSPAGAGRGARPPITLVSSFLWMSGIFHRKRLWKLFASERVLIYLLIILDYHTFHAAGWKKPLSGKITKSLAYLVTHKIPLGSWKILCYLKGSSIESSKTKSPEQKPVTWEQRKVQDFALDVPGFGLSRKWARRRGGGKGDFKKSNSLWGTSALKQRRNGGWLSRQRKGFGGQHKINKTARWRNEPSFSFPGIICTIAKHHTFSP